MNVDREADGDRRRPQLRQAEDDHDYERPVYGVAASRQTESTALRPYTCGHCSSGAGRSSTSRRARYEELGPYRVTQLGRGGGGRGGGGVLAPLRSRSIEQAAAALGLVNDQAVRYAELAPGQRPSRSLGDSRSAHGAAKTLTACVHAADFQPYPNYWVADKRRQPRR